MRPCRQLRPEENREGLPSKRRDKIGKKRPEIFGAEPQLTSLGLHRRALALDILQVLPVGRMFVGGKFGKIGCESGPETDRIALGNKLQLSIWLSVILIGMTTFIISVGGVFIGNIVAHLVEKFILLHCQVIERQ